MVELAQEGPVNNVATPTSLHIYQDSFLHECYQANNKISVFQIYKSYITRKKGYFFFYFNGSFDQTASFLCRVFFSIYLSESM